MVKLTSDAVDKLIDKYTGDVAKLVDKIENCSTYVAAITEDEKSLAPDFDFMATVNEIEDLQQKILVLRHARNQFNNTTEVINGLTVDQVLVRMSMLNRQKVLFLKLSKRMPKERVNSRLSATKEIEYTYVNYKIEDAKDKYDAIESEIYALRKALNIVNSTKEFDVDIVL